MKKIVVTIARGFGSGGRSIGQMLSEKLGIAYYDKDIITLASEDSGINEQLFALHDEKTSGGLFKKSKVYNGEIIPPTSNDFVSAENLFNYQAKTIKQLAEKESCIIVGRCADHILRNSNDVIKAFIWADNESCIANVMKIFNLDRSEAIKRIEKIDKDRRAYYKQHTGNNWDDVRNYDICLNTSNLGFEKCVDIIANYIDIMNK